MVMMDDCEEATPLEELYKQRDAIVLRINALEQAQKNLRHDNMYEIEESAIRDERLDLILNKYPEYNNEQFVQMYLNTPYYEIARVEQKFGVDPNPHTANNSLYRQRKLANIPTIEQKQLKIKEFAQLDEINRHKLPKDRLKKYKKSNALEMPKIR